MLLLVASNLLFGQTAEQNLLKKVEQQHQQWVSLVANFVQTDYDKDSQVLNTAKGQVAFLKPGLMRWQYLPPEEQTIVIGKNKVWVYDPVLENVSIQKTEQVEGIDFLRTLAKNGDLTQNFQLLERQAPGYKAANSLGQKLMQPKKNQAVLHFRPKKTNTNIKSLHLTVDPQDYAVQAFGVIDVTDEKRIIQFLNIRLHSKSGPVNEQDFVFLIPDGVDIIEK